MDEAWARAFLAELKATRDAYAALNEKVLDMARRHGFDMSEFILPSHEDEAMARWHVLVFEGYSIQDEGEVPPSHPTTS